MSIIIPRKLLSEDNVKLIRKYLTMTPQMSAFEKFGPMAHMSTDKKESIIFYLASEHEVSLPYFFCRKLLPDYEPKYDHAKRNFDFTGELYDNQKQVEKEIIEQLNKYNTTHLSLYTGFGKTLMSSKLSCMTKTLTVILFNREIIGEQWLDTFIKNTSAKCLIVEKEVEEKDIEGIDILLCMNTRWTKISHNVRKQVGMMIIDEAHLFCVPSNVGCLLSFTPKYIVACSATMERTDGMNSMISSMIGLHKVERKLTKKFNVVKLLVPFSPETKTNMRGLDYNSYLSSIVNSDMVNTIAVNLIKSNMDKRKILALSSRKDHIKKISDKLQEDNVNHDYLMGSKNKYVDSKVLLGTLSKISTGFDAKAACKGDNDFQHLDLLILLTSIKNAATLQQTVGRVFRSSEPEVIYLVYDHKIAKKHFNEGKKWFVSVGGNIVEKKLE